MLWDALQQLEGDPIASLGEAEAVAKSLLLGSRPGSRPRSNQMTGNLTSSISNETQVIGMIACLIENTSLVPRLSCLGRLECRLPRELGACTNSVYQALFPPPLHKSLGTRL